MKLCIAFTTWFAFSCRQGQASPHDEYQSKVEIKVAPQQYFAADARRLSTAASTPSCMQAAASGTWAPIRIGYEFVNEADASGNPIPTKASAAMQTLVMNTFMTQAVAYYQSTLQVIQATAPLTFPRAPSGSSIQYSFESAPTYSAAVAPTCGITTVPVAYLQAARTASQRCSPGYACTGACIVNSACQCNFTTWALQPTSYCCLLSPSTGCLSGCSASNVLVVGSGLSGGVVCEGGVNNIPAGPGIPNEDHHVLVTISDTSCSGGTLAYSVKCFRDQCDRPLMSQINFCYSQLASLVASGSTSSYSQWISVAVHELTHSLVFSSGLFPFFRNADGSPMFPRSATVADTFTNQQRWTCNNNVYKYPDPTGNSVYLDMSPNFLNTSTERGIGPCQCPIGTSTLGAGCLPPSTGAFFAMSCVVRIQLPNVLREVRNYFNCPSLTGAELENQDTSSCSIIGSHWEQRVFNAELLSPIVGTVPFTVSHLSRVTLALFQDSGWYKANLNNADALVKGVHWGYQQGCDFATQPCVAANGSSLWSAGFCTGVFTGDATQNVACSLDRLSVVACDRAAGNPASTGIFNYFGDGSQGSVPQLDYCPTYRLSLGYRMCNTKASYSTLPYGNVNLRREVANSNSRCLMANLYTNTDGTGNGAKYVVSASSFPPAPMCYQVTCSADNSSYVVSMATSTATSGVQVAGTCTADGQVLTVAGYQGGITCAAPAIMCQVVVNKASVSGAVPSSRRMTPSEPAATPAAVATAPRPAKDRSAPSLRKLVPTSAVTVAGSVSLTVTSSATLASDSVFLSAINSALATMLGAPAGWLTVALVTPDATTLVANYTAAVPNGGTPSVSTVVQRVGAMQPSDFTTMLNQALTNAGKAVSFTVTAVSAAQELAVVAPPTSMAETTTAVPPAETTTVTLPTTSAKPVVPSASVPPGSTVTWSSSSAAQPALCVGGVSDRPMTLLIGQQQSSRCQGTDGPSEFIIVGQVGMGISTDFNKFLQADGSMDPAYTRLLSSVQGLTVVEPDQQDSSGVIYDRHSGGGFASAVPTNMSLGWFWTGSSSYFIKQGRLSANQTLFRHQAYNIPGQRVDVVQDNICIATDSFNTTCGSASTFNAGTVAYAIYGYSDGMVRNVTNCQLTVGQANATSLGHRMLVNLTFMGVDVSSVTINGGLPLASGATVDVQNLTIQGVKTSLIIQAPQKYVAGSWRRGEIFPQNLRVRAAPHGADPTNRTFFLDFGVQIEQQLTFCQGYFAAQATIQAGQVATSKQQAGGSSSASPWWILAAGLLALLF